jgi:transcriptional regulator with XRE-family HTH domain
MNTTDNFRLRLRAAMLEKKLSQREVARKAATSYAGLNRILRGKQVPTLELAYRLAAAIGVSLSSLTNGKK